MSQDCLLTSQLNKEQKLLHQLGIEDNQVVSARTYTAPSVSSSMALVPLSSASTSQPATDASGVILSSLGAGGGGGAAVKSSFELEQERQLPGVVMAAGGHVFDMLYTLADLDEPK